MDEYCITNFMLLPGRVETARDGCDQVHWVTEAEGLCKLYDQISLWAVRRKHFMICGARTFFQTQSCCLHLVDCQSPSPVGFRKDKKGEAISILIFETEKYRMHYKLIKQTHLHIVNHFLKRLERRGVSTGKREKCPLTLKEKLHKKTLLQVHSMHFHIIADDWTQVAFQSESQTDSSK